MTEVLKQASWGTLRDNLVLGSEGNGIDGAHILTPMPYLISSGKVTQNNQPTPMYILARLNLDGQCISVGKEYEDLKIGVDTAPFKVALDKKKASGKSVKAAMTFPGGTHDLWIRYWLAAGGIDPDKDIETIVVPPAQMVANMKVGTMDAFCVCEPWNLQLDPSEDRLHRADHRRTLGQAPREVVRHARCWVDKYPKAAKALLMAVMEAQQWCRKDREPRRDRGHLRQAAVDQRAGRGRHGSYEGQVRLRHRSTWSITRRTRCGSGRTTRPIRIRATISGSSPKTSAGANTKPATTPRR
jgi:nitrate/nitrite transport system substrate-binding protein